MNKKIKRLSAKRLCAIILTVVLVFALSVSAFAASEGDTSGDSSIGSKAIAAAVCVGLAAMGGALGMGIAIAKSNESIARQPEAEGKIRTSMMLGLVFIETAIIYALVVAILVIFVL